MGAGRQTAEAYRKILASAKKHNVAVMGGPVLPPNAEGCRKASEDGVRVRPRFHVFPKQVVRALANGIEGQSEWRRPPLPESGFPATN